MEIRDAKSEDLEAMLDLARQSATAAHWAESFYRGLFESEAVERISLVAEDEGVIQGFLIARIMGDECELENVVVAEGSRGGGIGSKLICALMECARAREVARIFLEVRESNTAARGLYERSGFRINGRRKSYYNDPADDAVLYIRAP